jgi:muramoyltetrapeptide carboxypeptidase
MGLKTVYAPNAFAQHYYSAGTPQQRADDFNWALKNPDVKGILLSVGGSTAIDLVDKIDYDYLKRHPKVIAGISDASTLLNAITTKTGLITFHGLEYLDISREKMTYTLTSLKKAWLEGELGEYAPNPDWRDFDNLPTSYQGWSTIQKGLAEGEVVGGNFRCSTQLMGTPYFRTDLTDTIFVLETYKWPKKNIYQALINLKLWGVFDQISGLIIGYCLGSDDPAEEGNNQSMVELAQEAISGYGFPAMWIGEIGHNVEDLILPIGAQLKMDATHLKLSALEKVTE